MTMAPFTISPHHSLSYQCQLPPAAPYNQSKMNSESLSNTSGTHQDLPLNLYHRTSIFSMLLKIRLHLWWLVQRVMNCCMSVTKLFSSNTFFFICVGKNTAMMGELKKGAVEAQERPGWEFMSEAVHSDEEMKDPEKELDDDELSKHAERHELSVNDSDEEEEDKAQLSEWESEEETDEEDEEEDEAQPPQEEDWERECDDDVDSEWSDDDDDDDDSEASAESLELWESFNNSDPYNPLSFFSCIGVRTNTASTSKNLKLSPQMKQAESTSATKTEEHHPKTSTKKGEKKVSFSDKVPVHHMVAWSFASRAARDGSCWMQMARDRERFRRRVESVETVITLCLTHEHRAAVWERHHKEISS